MKYLLSSFLALSSIAWGEPHYRSEVKAFGVRLRTETVDHPIHESLKSTIETEIPKYQISMDPDCRWRKPKDGICENPEAQETAKIEAFAELMAKETLGFYNFRQRDGTGRVKRDFDGLSQGYFIEAVKAMTVRPWLMDFAGDIYFSGGFEPEFPFTIPNPFLERLPNIKPYAQVKMASGFMLASTGRPLGASIRGEVNDPDRVDDDIHRVILFASPKFDGGRLDAWDTAIIAGGPKVVTHLETLLEFKGQWAYLYFENKKNPFPPVCSTNLKCDLDEDGGVVRVPNW